MILLPFKSTIPIILRWLLKLVSAFYRIFKHSVSASTQNPNFRYALHGGSRDQIEELSEEIRLYKIAKGSVKKCRGLKTEFMSAVLLKVQSMYQSQLPSPNSLLMLLPTKFIVLLTTFAQAVPFNELLTIIQFCIQFIKKLVLLSLNFNHLFSN